MRGRGWRGARRAFLCEIRNRQLFDSRLYGFGDTWIKHARAQDHEDDMGLSSG